VTPWSEADPVPEQPWRETSSAGIRRLALQAAAEAVRKAREKRPDEQAEKAGQA